VKRGKEKVVLGTEEEEEEEEEERERERERERGEIEEGIKYEWGREKGELCWGRYRGGARV
jgi:hypothetical protein